MNELCYGCIRYDGPRPYADNTVELTDGYVLDKSKDIAPIGESFSEGFKQAILLEHIRQEIKMLTAYHVTSTNKALISKNAVLRIIEKYEGENKR